MKCSFQLNKQSNPSFGINARIVRKSYYKATDNLINFAVKRTVDGMDIETALSRIAGKSVDSMNSTYGDSFVGVCENFMIVKNNFPKANLADALKRLVKSSGMVDENGVFNKSPLRVLVIKPGTDHLDDINADTIVNNGVSGLKKIVADNVRVNNVYDPELNIFANRECKIKNSTCNSIWADTFAELENITAIEGIKSEYDILATNVITPEMKSERGATYLRGENNKIDYLTAWDSIISCAGLTAIDLKSKAGDILLDGKIIRINKVDANGLFSYSAMPKSDNYVNYADAKNIEAINAKGIHFCATDSISLFGLENKVDNLSSNGTMELENIKAKSINCYGDLIKFLGNKNKVSEKIRASKTIDAKNLDANIVECESLIDNGNVNVKDLRIFKANP